MTSKRRIARRWRPDQIDRFANVPDLAKADELAREIGGAVELLWNAEKDPDARPGETEPPAPGMGRQE